jgi:hypothetical protein
MSIDVVDLRNFYGQRLGVVARRFVGRGIRSPWRDTAGQRCSASAMPHLISDCFARRPSAALLHAGRSEAS